MNWMSTRVLVTGAGGFIGSHLVERLVHLGAETTAFVRYTSDGSRRQLAHVAPEVVRALRVVQGDIRDPHATLKAAANQHIVFHLAAAIAIPYSYVHPIEVAETNVMGTLNILMACRDVGVGRLVHTSTSEVYGTARYVPIDEQHPLTGQSPYAASKIGADKLAESFHRSFGTPVVTVRPFNTYGPRQSARAVIPTIISQALAGGDIYLGTTTPTRDLTFVADTVEGFVKAASADDEAVVGQTFNLGNGREITIGALADRIIALTGSRAGVATDSRRIRPVASEVQRLVAETGCARQALDWSPQTTLDAGLRQTIDWVSANPHLFVPAQYTI